MDIREKLIEILKQAPFEGKVLDEWWWEEKIKRIAEYLISNGVTVQENVEISDELLKQLKNAPITICKEEPSIELVQEWISVDERLPDNKEYDWVLAQVVEDNGYMHIPKVMEYRQSKNDWFEEIYGWLSEHNGTFRVTHWMPLPEPPKEDE